MLASELTVSLLRITSSRVTLAQSQKIVIMTMLGEGNFYIFSSGELENGAIPWILCLWLKMMDLSLFSCNNPG